MKKFAMVLVVLSAMLVIVNCAKKEEVVQQAPVVETPAVVEEVPAVVDSAAAVVDSAAAAVEAPATEVTK